jgi:hypothetical protein
MFGSSAKCPRIARFNGYTLSDCVCVICNFMDEQVCTIGYADLSRGYLKSTLGRRKACREYLSITAGSLTTQSAFEFTFCHRSKWYVCNSMFVS